MHLNPERPITRHERVALAGFLAVIALAMLAVGCQSPVPEPETNYAAAGSASTGPAASAVYAAQLRMLYAMHMMFPEVVVDVRWIPCGEENSFYYSDTKTIKLCTEMASHPGTAVFFAAHEFGHAVTDEMMNFLDEQSADEIGALAMLELGLRDEVVEAALYHATSTYQGHIPGDPHPSNGYRAWELLCLEDGSEEHPADPECKGFYSAMRLRWYRRLFDKVETLDDSE